MKYSSIYLIPGYGIPKNIQIDEHYRHYLSSVFNQIFDLSQNQAALVIFSGGKTDMIKPYRRTEAEEMKKFFKKLASRSVVRKMTTSWQLVPEIVSLSTIENVLYAKKILDRKNIKSGNVIIFCEFTRTKKIKTFAKKIFGTSWKIKIIPVDFDVSQNRYHTDLVAKKEAEDIRLGLWALKNPKNLQSYRKVLKEKLIYLRKTDFASQPEAIRKYWESMLMELKKDRKNYEI